MFSKIVKFKIINKKFENLDNTYSEKSYFKFQPEANTTNYFNPGDGNFRVMSTTDTNRPYRYDYLLGQGFSTYGTIFSAGGANYPVIFYVDVFGKMAVWSSNQSDWRALS